LLELLQDLFKGDGDGVFYQAFNGNGPIGDLPVRNLRDGSMVPNIEELWRSEES
jgi:hypothetical protein